MRRVLGGGAAWVAGAVASIAVSMLALSIIGVESAGALPVSPQPVAQVGQPATGGPLPAPIRSAAQPPVHPSSAPGSRGPTGSTGSGSPTSVQRQFDTDFGGFSARCTGDLAYLLSWSPAPDFHAANVQRGPGVLVRLSFVGSARTISFRVRCVGGVPHMSTDGDE